jgi:hypothetical protein
MKFVRLQIDLQLDEVQDKFLTDHISSMGFALTPAKMKLAKQALLQEITKRRIDSMSELRSMVDRISNPVYIDIVSKAIKF